MTGGWDESAGAWIAAMGESGDFAREFVLDGAMLARVDALVRGRAPQEGPLRALDVGCGEGRFCRMLRARGVEAVGIDPTRALVARARELDPSGTYRIGRAEALDVADDTIDLVVSYLSLVDVPDLTKAIAEMARVVRPGGRVLIANLSSFNTAGIDGGWSVDPDGIERFTIDRYLEERATIVAWRGIRIENWHRPLSRYMSSFLAEGLVLRHFDEPSPTGGDPERRARYERVPWFVVMEWERPASRHGG
jgi:SAM-dependent methyltransferase